MLKAINFFWTLSSKISFVGVARGGDVVASVARGGGVVVGVARGGVVATQGSFNYYPSTNQ